MVQSEFILKGAAVGVPLRLNTICLRAVHLPANEAGIVVAAFEALALVQIGRHLAVAIAIAVIETAAENGIAAEIETAAEAEKAAESETAA